MYLSSPTPTKIYLQLALRTVHYERSSSTKGSECLKHSKLRSVTIMPEKKHIVTVVK